ncbi:unnamed protein product [Brassica napus]|uniref:(rape) hypothetical protein n=1 Tax=Brassica napus TaxID=3708 RepID=A0A817B1E2_BRANA|nr:unnamed protein product [Brassica napus]
MNRQVSMEQGSYGNDLIYENWIDHQSFHMLSLTSKNLVQINYDLIFFISNNLLFYFSLFQAIALIGDWKQEIYNKIAMCRGFTILITSAKLATICSMKPS